MSNYSLEHSFGIDNGELDGLSPQQCFVLGYELAEIMNYLGYTYSFARYVHVDNRGRIENALKMSGRRYDFKWPKDGYEEWIWLDVKSEFGEDESDEDKEADE